MPREGWYRDPIAERWWDGVDWTRLIKVKGESKAGGPVASVQSVSPAGWKPDPFAERFWNGSQWTTETRPSPTMPLGLKPSLPGSPSSLREQSISADNTLRAQPPRSEQIETPKSRKRAKVVAIVAGVVALTAFAVVFFARRGAPSAEDSLVAVTAPVAALPTQTSGGFLQTFSGPPVRLTANSCGGLLAQVDGSSCIEGSFGGVLHALVFLDDGESVTAQLFAVTTTEGQIEAAPVMKGTVARSREVGSRSSANAYLLGLVTGDVLVLVVESRVGDEISATTQFIGEISDGSAGTLAVVSGTELTLAADSDRVFVLTSRKAQASGILLTEMFPVRGQWTAVEQVLDQTSAESLVSERKVVLFRAKYDGLSSQSAAALPTTQPSMSTPVPTEAPLSPAALVPGASLVCDGTWISIVASQPQERLAEALDDHPGSKALKNEESCASLNPFFSSGSYAGQPIYVVFFGPFLDRERAQSRCLSLGLETKSECYVAPLTNDPADRSVRFGPTD